MQMVDRLLLAGWSKLVGSNLLSSVLLLAANAVAAQALGVEDFGRVAMVLAYAKVVDGLFNFQSVNVLNRFLTEAREAGATARVAAIVKLGALVDIATAWVAFAVAVLGIQVFGHHFGLTEDLAQAAMLMCLVIPTRIFGVTEAVLRTFNRFWAIGLRQTLMAGGVAAGWTIAWVNGLGVAGFLAIWAVAEIAANLWYILHCRGVLRENRISAILHARLADALAGVDGFWRMLIQTNLTYGIRMLTQDADLLIAGAWLGSGAAGILRVAKDVAGMAGQFGRPLQQAASTRIYSLANGPGPAEALRYTIRVGAVAGGAGALVALSSILWVAPVLGLIYGMEFVAAAWIATSLLFSKSIFLCGVTVSPLTTALSIAGSLLKAVMAGTVAFLAILLWATPIYGLMGIALAHLAFEITWLAYSWWEVRAELARRISG